MAETLKDFVQSYWNEKWLDVSSIIPNVQEQEMPQWPMMQESVWYEDEYPELPDFKSHVEQMRPMLSNMTEWELMTMIADIITEYNKLWQADLD